MLATALKLRKKPLRNTWLSVEESDSEESPSSDSDILIDMVSDQQESCSTDEDELSQNVQFKNWWQLEAAA